MATEELDAAPDRSSPQGTDIMPLREGAAPGLWKISLAGLAAFVGASAGFERPRVKPLATDFTLENANGGTITDGTYGIVLEVPTGTGGIRFVRDNNAPPAAPYSVIVRSSSIFPQTGTGIYHQCLIARNSSNGRLMIFGQYDSGFLIQRFTSYTAFSANAWAPVQAFNGVGNWMRYTVSATNITFAYSPNGEDWYDFYTETLATFLTASGGTLDQVGFGGFMNGTKIVDLFESYEAA